jgi:TonB family protein
VLNRIEPEYTEEARKAGVSASVSLRFIVAVDGIAQEIKVLRGAGFGLDERAVEAVSNWRFQPAMKEGAPAPMFSQAEVIFRQLNRKREGQFDRLNFSLPVGTSRPELIRGSMMPENPRDVTNASLQVSLTVAADGAPQDVSIVKSTSPRWADQVLKDVRKWHFRPAIVHGQAVEVKGILEVVVGPAETIVTISSSDAIDVSLPAPRLVLPADGVTFDIYPRRTTCQWEPSAGAVSYVLEWDYSYNGKWHSEEQKMAPGILVNSTEYSFDFVGAQLGRWRVWPVSASGNRGTPSEWRTFRYTR